MRQRRALLVSPPEVARGASARGIFPLRLTRQPIGAGSRALSCHFAVEPADVGPCIVPAHTHYRIAINLIESGMLPIEGNFLVPVGCGPPASVTDRVTGLTNESGVITPGDGMAAESKRPQRHDVLR